MQSIFLGFSFSFYVDNSAVLACRRWWHDITICITTAALSHNFYPGDDSICWYTRIKCILEGTRRQKWMRHSSIYHCWYINYLQDKYDMIDQLCYCMRQASWPFASLSKNTLYADSCCVPIIIPEFDKNINTMCPLLWFRCTISHYLLSISIICISAKVSQDASLAYW